MSWFDATGLANIAKSALKEAQRTIDKALDIKDDVINENNMPVDINSDDFFGTWIGQPTLTQEDKKDKLGTAQQSNVWGSFTGSFFDNSREYKQSVSLEGLDDSADINSQQFSQSKLVVEENDMCESVPIQKDEIKDLEDTISSQCEDVGDNKIYKEQALISDFNLEMILSSQGKNQVFEPEDSLTTNVFDDVKPEDVNLAERQGEENVSSTLPELKSKEDSISACPIEKNPLPEAITVAPSRNIVPIQMSSIVDDNLLIDTQPQSSKQELPDILKSSNVIDIPLDDDSLKSSSENPLEVSTDEGSQSDVTIKGEDAPETSTEKAGIENTEYLSSLLAEAISDKDSASVHTCNHSDSNSHNDGMSSDNLSIVQLEMPPREYSPLSSDKSDLVKIGSDHTSGHTSGDELETATSSDIEIISSPNGDSSSTQSRQSPAKQTTRKMGKVDSQVDSVLCKMTLKSAKGHNRELSEASSISDDCHSIEVDKLVRKITEMTEILESRESKLVDVNRKNIELQELNMELKSQLNSILTKQHESQDLTQVTEDYAQRMSILEKKFQQAIREKDSLRKQLEQTKQESAARLSKGEFDSIINEKDEMIKQLREEGEKLSKQQLQHSTIIKKLRVKEKENETAIKQLKEKVEDFTSETDRLKRTVNAKEEVERTQIEAVNQLTSKNKKLENDLAKIQSELDDQVQKYETLRKSLDAAKKELSDKNKITNQLSAKEQMLESLENEKKVAVSQNEEVIGQLQYLRLKLHEYECDYSQKERNLKQENMELLKRIENAESRNEELSQQVIEVSKPLVRQLESLQATHNLKMAHFEKTESDLTSKLSDIQFRFKSAISSERLAKEECIALRSKLSSLEVELSTAIHQKDLLEVQVEQTKTEKTILQQELKTKMEELHTKLKTKNDKIEVLNEEIVMLKSSLKKAIEEVSQKETIRQELEDNIDDTNSNPRSTSPTLSVGKASVADSLASSVWSQLEAFDVGHAPRYTNMLEIQMLQTNLQQREGELQQLQWELNRREQERNLIHSELTSLTSKVDDLTKSLTEYELLKPKFEELQAQYDVLCQMYGEKVDEVQELRLDLLEAKEAYKSQLDELLSNQNSPSS